MGSGDGVEHPAGSSAGPEAEPLVRGSGSLNWAESLLTFQRPIKAGKFTPLTASSKLRVL